MASEITDDAIYPGAPTSLNAEPSIDRGHTEIDLTWVRPTVDRDGTDGDSDGIGNGDGMIVGYLIETSPDGENPWTELATADPEDDCTGDDPDQTTETVTCTYTHDGLVPGQSVHYRVSTINEGPDQKTSDTSNTDVATTRDSTEPDKPGGLVAEDDGPTTIKLCWNAQSEEPPAAPITSYVIQYKTDGDWMDLATVSEMGTAGMVRTTHVATGLMADTAYQFRVRAVNLVGDSAESDTAMAMTPEAMAPDAPTDVTATATSHTAITVRWTAPADPDGAPVTGYMVESAYEMSDGTMSDWMAVDPAHEGMEMMYVDMGLMPMTKYYYRVSAMNSVGTGMASDGMAYAMTAMTPTAPMVSGTAIADVMMTVGDAAVMRDASAAFTEADGDAVTYDATSSNTDAATVSVSGSMISIMAVAAGDSTVSVTASDKDGTSDAVTFMVTVEAANSDPMAMGTIPAVMIMVDETSDVTLGDYFSDADGDPLMYTQMSSNSAVATAMIATDDSDPGAIVHTLTITGHMAGDATITVTASDEMGGTDATQTIMVTVEAAPMPLMAPTITGTNPVGSGIVLVSWNAVANATGYSLIATNLSDPSAPTRTAAAGADETSGQIQDLTVGDEYLVFVGAFNNDLEFELSAYVRVTAE